MEYKHGNYGTVEETYDTTAVSQKTIPAYIGSLPIHRINSNGDSSFDYSDYVKKPILITSLRQAKALGLYSDNWSIYTLCEAIHAHFMNGENSVAPFIVINVLDPATDIAESATKTDITMKKVGTKYIGYIEDPLCCVSELALTATGATVSNTTYYYSGDKVVVETEATGASLGNSFTAEATYKRIDFTSAKFTSETIEAALESLDYCEQLTGYIPNVLAAPGISEKPELHSLMIQKAIDKISTKHHFVCLSDIPASEDTYAKAEDWKKTNAYDSKLEKVYWPSLAYGDKVYHASTIGAYAMQALDTANNGVPYKSTSNKSLFVDRAVVGTGATLMISEQDANELNKIGVTTVNLIKGGIRFWGVHMANYNFTTISDIAPEDRFDASVRMSMYILNYLQTQYLDEIDESFTRKDVDSMVNGIQTWLDSLVNDGMLLYATVSFNNESNSDADIANGDFAFDIQVTYTVIAKSITFKLQYTSEGLSVITTEGGIE